VSAPALIRPQSDRLLEQGLLPGIRLGRRWIVTRHAYEQWELTCGMQMPTVPTKERVQ
jgi:hypothetical protein